MTFPPTPTAPAAADADQRARLAVLSALRALPDLARDYVLKGGLVLQHVYGSPRVSDDLDFNHVRAHPNEVCDENTQALQDVVDRLDAAVGEAAGGCGLEAASVHVLKWSELLPTVFAEARYRTAAGATGAVEVQVTLCERVCHTALGRIGGVPVLVPTVDDLVADKLKVLLQQHRRHKVRHSDVYDLWFLLAEAPFVPDPATARASIETKMESWPDYLPLVRSQFRAEGVRTFAEAGYRALRAEQPDLPFAPFDVVWDAVGAFVDAMDLPAGD